MHPVPVSTVFLALARIGWHLLATALLAFGLCGVVVAAAGSTNSTVTTSTSRTPDTFVDTTLPAIRVDTFRTRLIGLLPGNATPVYDQTFAFPFADPAVQNGLLAAQSALNAASPGPLSILVPVLQSSQSTLLGSNTVTNVIGVPVVTQTVGLGESIGPGTINIGDIGNCAGLQTATIPLPYVGGFSQVTDYPFGCSGGAPVPFVVLAGTVNLNVNTNTQTQFTRELQATDTWELFQTWRITAVPQAAPAPVSIPALDTLSLVVLGLGLLGWGRQHLRRAKR